MIPVGPELNHQHDRNRTTRPVARRLRWTAQR